MKAAFIQQPGPPGNLQVADLPDPKPGPGQALVRVRASTVNPIDTYIRAGLIPFPLPLPYVVGCDLAGTVEAVGTGVRRYKPGDRVWGSNQGLLGRQGTTAELAVVDEHWLYPTPEGVDDKDAAAIALVGITAHLGLFRDGGLRAGETVFINGGSGGVGSVVVQMARNTGARVIATAGSEENAAICRDLGADEVILYKRENVAERVRALAPDGVNLWYETQREPDLETNVPLLANGGRMILMAGRDAHPSLPLGNFYTRDCKLLGFAMFNATPKQQRHAANCIYGWMSEGKLRPRIGRAFPIERIAEAHQLQEDNTVGKAGTLAGKIVITI
jgi:NADPH2:quinone reductase